MTHLAIAVFFYMCHFVVCSNILYLSTSPGKSHHIWDKTLALALRDRGHQITFVSNFLDANEDNFTLIHLEGVIEKLQNVKHYDMEKLKKKPFEKTNVLFDYTTLFCKLSSETKGFQYLLNKIESTKYDLIMADIFCFVCMYPLVEKTNFPPFIGTLQYGIIPDFTFFLGSDLHTSYIPINRFPYTDKMSFLERVHNFVVTVETLLYRKFVYMHQNTAIAKQHFGDDITPLEDIEKRMSLLFVNYDHILDYPQSLPPTIIPVGGLHVQRNEKLPKNLEKILNSSKEGAVFFSMGSFLKWSSIKPEEINIFIEAFKAINKTVIWKCDKNLKNLPDNIILHKWIPQAALLAHPNVKLFITHGGALGTYEAMHYGVPLLVIPFFLDQFKNAERISSREIGLKLFYEDLTSETLTETITTLLNNSKFQKNMKEISLRFRNQPMDPLSKAVLWTEYVLKQNGTLYLHVAAQNLSFIQRYMLDVICFLSIIVAFCVYFFYFIAQTFYYKYNLMKLKKKIE